MASLLLAFLEELLAVCCQRKREERLAVLQRVISAWQRNAEVYICTHEEMYANDDEQDIDLQRMRAVAEAAEEEAEVASAVAEEEAAVAEEEVAVAEEEVAVAEEEVAKEEWATHFADCSPDCLQGYCNSAEDFRLLMEFYCQCTASEFTKAETMHLSPDKAIVQKIQDCAAAGINRAHDVEVILQSFVRDLFHDKDLPSPLDRRYFPSCRDILNIIASYRKKTLVASTDQERVGQLLKTFKKWGLGDVVGFEQERDKVVKVWCKTCARYSNQIRCELKGKALQDAERYIVGTSFVTKFSIQRHLGGNAHKIGQDFARATNPDSTVLSVPKPDGAIGGCLYEANEDCIPPLAVDGQPLTNFKTLVAVQKANGIPLIQGCHSSDRAREFITEIASAVRQKLSDALQKTTGFPNLNDGSQARKELILLRLMKDGSPIYVACALEDIDSYEGINPFSLLIPDDQYINCLVSATADGASVNFGKHNGVLTQLTEEGRPWLLKIHCICHRVELTFKDTLLKLDDFSRDFMVEKAKAAFEDLLTDDNHLNQILGEAGFKREGSSDSTLTQSLPHAGHVKRKAENRQIWSEGETTAIISSAVKSFLNAKKLCTKEGERREPAEEQQDSDDDSSSDSDTSSSCSDHTDASFADLDWLVEYEIQD
ncbi:hypothetical protein CAPTEDRAFT_202281 [Capitella teleta]|uniref:DUF4371 domain-containing protein n=1 Tax=Capitella teleta TaxID=283909 RepID=R7T9N0_CAPTE|nr:hypothetical protein CAPTEDRAFT_202281 [Capitella teleta]|eukprot:ELT90404.1 hypothetical protein CAPTEDRAFT_202281 [Capitella teleta]